MIVCVFLRGGADTLSLLVPKGDDAYFRARPELAVKGALDLDGFYGLHPAAAALLPAFREGALAFVQGVGCDDTSGSHFVAQERVERGEAECERASGGWLARALRSRGAEGPLTAIAIGDRVPDSLLGAPQVTATRALSELTLRVPGGSAPARRALRLLYEAARDRELTDPARGALDAIARVESLGPPGASAALDFGAGLAEIARLSRAGVGLEVACVDLAGWDTHFFQGAIFAERARTLAAGLASFHAAVPEATVIVLTEFGRRAYENGSAGTDHGRGFAMMLLGARVQGGAVYGAWPGLAEDPGPGPGGLPVRVECRAVLAEIAEAHGARADAVCARVAPTRFGLFR